MGALGGFVPPGAILARNMLAPGKFVECLFCTAQIWMPEGSPIKPICPECTTDPTRRKRKRKIVNKEPRAYRQLPIPPLTPC